MYCKKCGKLLNDGDRFCSACGTKVDEAPSFDKAPAEEHRNRVPEEKEKKPVHLDEFNWDLDGYPTEQSKTEDIDFNWTSVVEDRKHKKIYNDIEADNAERIPDVEPPEDNGIDLDSLFAAAEDTPAPSEKEEDEPSHKAASGSEKVDKFYTFSKKNEEFQALLDQEYERIRKNGNDHDDFTMPGIDMNETEEPAGAAFVQEAAEEPEVTVSEEAAEPEEQAEKKEAEEVCDTASEKTAEAVRLADTPETVITWDEPETEEEEQAEAPEEKKDEAAAEMPPSSEEEEPHKITFDDVFADDDSEEEPEKKGGFLKALGIIILIIAIVLGAAYAVMKFAPDTQAAKVIEKGYNKVLEIAGKTDGSEQDEQAEPAGEPTAHELSMADLAEQAGEKYENIAKAEFDPELVFEGRDEDMPDGFELYGDFKTIDADEAWYTDDAGNTVTYAGAAIDTLAGAFDALIEQYNKGEADFSMFSDTSDTYDITGADAEGKEYGINRLSVGETRNCDGGFYTLTSVAAVSSDSKEESEEEYLVYMEPLEQEMKVISINKL